MSLSKLHNESDLDFKYRILLEKAKGEADYGWDDIEKSLKIGLAKDTIRKGSIFLPEFDEYLRNKLTSNDMPKYKETTEIKADGSHSSDKLIRISDEDMKNPDFLLESHGFNPKEWQLTGAKNSIWNSGVDNTLYSSRITVKPKNDNELNVEKLVEMLKSEIKPSKAQYESEEGENLLSVFLTDMHWGISFMEDYEKTMNKTISKINFKKWDTILFTIGSDILHNDGFTGQTTRGTIIDKVDMEKAWKDAFIFYCNLIEEAIKNSNNVDVLFIDGNHDQAISWAFIKALELKFPQIKFESEMKHRKAYTWKNVFLAFSHGDKAKGNRLVSSILAEYGKDLAKASIKEIHSGHYHFEKSRDDFGIVTRTLSTGAKIDGYHYDNGFLGANKRFQLFEYSSDELETIYYV